MSKSTTSDKALVGNWLLVQFTTKVNPVVENVSRLYTLEMPLTLFEDGAKTFEEVKGLETCVGRTTQEHQQFMYAMIERIVQRTLKNKVKASSNAPKAVKGKVKGNKKKVAKKRGGKGRRADDEAGEYDKEDSSAEMDLSDGDIDSHIDGMALDGDEDDGMRTDPDSSAEEDMVARGTVASEDPEDSRSNIEIYMEAVRADPEKVRSCKNASGVAFGICGYRLFLLLRGDLKLESAQKEILQENHNLFFSRVSQPKGAGGRGGPSTESAGRYEKYKNITSKADLVAASGLYANTSYFQTQMSTINKPSKDIEDETTNPVSARYIYSPLTGFMRTDPRAVEKQSIHNKDFYFSKAEGGPYTIRFPYPKFVMRVYPEQCTVEKMSLKYFPHHQAQSHNPVVYMWPYIFNEPPKAPEDNVKQLVEELAAAVGGIGLDDYDRDMTSQEVEAVKKTDDMFLSPSQQNLKKALVTEMAIEAGFPNHQSLIAMKPFDQGTLAMRQRYKDTLDTLRDNQELKSGSSAYYEIGSDAKAVKEKLRSASYATIKYVHEKSVSSDGYEEWNEMPRGDPQYSVPTNARDATPEHITNKKMLILRKNLVRCRQIYLVNQRYSLNQYVKNCRSDSSNISPAGKSILKNVVQRQLYSIKREKHKIDRSHTSFSNWVIQKMVNYEQIFYLSDKHIYMFIIEVASLDAFRHQYNLHMNVITASEMGGQSKSFMWDLLVEMRDKGSISIFTYQSTRADATDENKCDVVRIFHEMPRSMFVENGKSDDLVASIKEQQTSMKTRAMVFDVEATKATGMRKSRTVECECVCVWMGSTNTPISEISMPVRSRYYILPCDKEKEPRRTIPDLQMAEGMRSEEDKRLRDMVTMDCMLEQAIKFEVEKMIQCDILTEPTMDACMVFLVMAEDMLKKRGYEPNDGRFFNRNVLAARNFAIMEHIHSTFFSMAGEHYCGEILPHHFLTLDRKLVGFVHHAVMALGLSSKLLINATEPTVLSGIINYHKHDSRFRDEWLTIGGDKKHKKKYNKDEGRESGDAAGKQKASSSGRRQQHDEARLKAVHEQTKNNKQTEVPHRQQDSTRGQPDTSFYDQYFAPGENVMDHDGGEDGNRGDTAPLIDGDRGGDATSGAPVHRQDAMQEDQEYAAGKVNYNYISFKKDGFKSISDFSGSLSTDMAADMAGSGSGATAPGPQVINGIIRDLTKKVFKCRNYIAPHPDDKRTDMNQVDVNSQPTSRPVCINTDTHISFLYEYLHTPQPTPLETISLCVKDILDRRHQLKRSMLSGISDETNPCIQNVIKTGFDDPNNPNYKDIAIYNPAYMQELERVALYGCADGPQIAKDRTRGYIIINTDIDLWSIEKRNTSLYVSPYIINPDSVSIDNWITGSPIDDLNAEGGGDGTGSDAASVSSTGSRARRHVDGGRDEDEDIWGYDVSGDDRCFFLGKKVAEMFARDPTGAGFTPERSVKELDSMKLRVFDGTTPDADMPHLSHYNVRQGDAIVPHWDAINNDGGHVTPHFYKMYGMHWYYANHLESFKDYGNTLVYNYPEDLTNKQSRHTLVEEAQKISCDSASRAISLQTRPECFVRELPSDALNNPYNSYLTESTHALSGIKTPDRLQGSSKRRLEEHMAKQTEGMHKDVRKMMEKTKERIERARMAEARQEAGLSGGDSVPQDGNTSGDDSFAEAPSPRRPPLRHDNRHTSRPHKYHDRKGKKKETQYKPHKTLPPKVKKDFLGRVVGNAGAPGPSGPSRSAPKRVAVPQYKLDVIKSVDDDEIYPLKRKKKAVQEVHITETDDESCTDGTYGDAVEAILASLEERSPMDDDWVDDQ